MSKEEKKTIRAEIQSLEEFHAVKNWWNKNSNLVTIVMCVILAAVIGMQQYTKYKNKKSTEAMSSLFGATNSSAEALEELIASSPSKAVTALARIRLANMYYSAEKYDLALNIYQEFLKDTPKHQLASIAEIGLAYTYEAMGSIENAAKAFHDISQKYQDGFLSQNATISYARNLVFLGKKDEAKNILDIFIASNAGTAWAESADELILTMDRIKAPVVKKFDIESFFQDEKVLNVSPGAGDVAAEENPVEAAPPAPTEGQ